MVSTLRLLRLGEASADSQRLPGFQEPIVEQRIVSEQQRINSLFRYFGRF